MADSRANQIAALKLSIASLEKQQRLSGLDLSAAIAPLQEALAPLEAKAILTVAALSGSGAVAQDHSVAAGAGGAAIGGDAIQSTIITGDRNVVNVTYQGATFRVPSPTAVQQHRAALRRNLEKEAQQR